LVGFRGLTRKRGGGWSFKKRQRFLQVKGRGGKDNAKKTLCYERKSWWRSKGWGGMGKKKGAAVVVGRESVDSHRLLGEVGGKVWKTGEGENHGLGCQSRH